MSSSDLPVQMSSLSISPPPSLFKRHRFRLKDILFPEDDKNEKFVNEIEIGKIVDVCGWTRTIRFQSKNTLAFISLNDGSCFESLQVVADESTTKNFDKLLTCGGIGSSMKISGVLTKPPEDAKSQQKIELTAKEIVILGTVDAQKYPLKKTKHPHSMEFLRENAHLRARTNLIGAVARVRNSLAFATHKFFEGRGFLYVHTPIITSSDCEGAGEMFQVTNLLAHKSERDKELPIVDKEREKILKKNKNSAYTPGVGEVDFSRDFFSRPSFLTVSGQLNVESYALGLSDVYTFGPTFRAENSHTSRHLAEFWMIEPETCFCTLPDVIDLAEDYIKFCVMHALSVCKDDLEFFEERIENGLLARLKNVVESPFERLPYTKAIVLLQDHIEAKKVAFNEKVFWGVDLASEHERYLTEQVFKKPVVVTDYPASFKAFYMKKNELVGSAGEDAKSRQTVQAMDILVPKIGELTGGSVREESLEKLELAIEEKRLKKSDFEWYLDLRRYGSVPHGGFGVGFERLVMFVTGVENIRDVIPFPRAPGQCEF